MLEDIPEQVQLPVLEHMQASAVKHAATSSVLFALELDTDTYPHQLLTDSIVRHSNELAPTDALNPLAQLIRPNYKKTMKLITDRREAAIETGQPSACLATNGFLTDSENVVNAYDHGEDVLTFILSAVAETNLQREESIDFRAGYIGSKMMDFLAVDVNGFGKYKAVAEALLEDAGIEIDKSGIVLARDILARVFHNQYFTIPNTQSSSSLRSQHDRVVSVFNPVMRTAIKLDMSRRLRRKTQPPLYLHVASPGSINRYLDIADFYATRGEEDYDFDCDVNLDEYRPSSAEVIGGASKGMVTFLKHAHTFAVVSKMLIDEPFLEIDPEPLKITSEPKLRTLGQKQMRLLDKADPTTTHIYDAGKNLPVTELAA